VRRTPLERFAETVEGRIDFLLPATALDPQNRLAENDPAAVRAALQGLGDAMGEPGELRAGPIPAAYTYFGQFLAHDIMRIKERAAGLDDPIKSDFDPLPLAEASRALTNTRRAALDLASLYGDGPSFDGEIPTEAQALGLYDGARLRTSMVAITPGAEPVPPMGLSARDLLRQSDAGTLHGAPPATALIADERNDENLILAQLHLAMALFHNRLVDRFEEAQPSLSPRLLFMAASRLARLHYQWLVVNDWLKRICDPAVVDSVLADGASLYLRRHAEVGGAHAFLPLEFTTAAFRFAHSMVRARYDWNANFPSARFDQLFQLTGAHGFSTALAGARTLPSSWVADWTRLADPETARTNGMARPIDIFLSPPLIQLSHEGNRESPGGRLQRLMKNLAKRNLLRGYLLSLPTGQAAAQAFGLEPLAPHLVERGLPTGALAAFRAARFTVRTPLWFYVLQESRIQADGARLGAVGSRLVAETVVGLLRADPQSYLNLAGGWTPRVGVAFDDGREIRTLPCLLRFAGVL
jgi:hypothetical protein